MRRPRMQGMPPIWRGSEVMRVNFIGTSATRLSSTNVSYSDDLTRLRPASPRPEMMDADGGGAHGRGQYASVSRLIEPEALPGYRDSEQQKALRSRRRHRCSLRFRFRSCVRVLQPA